MGGELTGYEPTMSFSVTSESIRTPTEITAKTIARHNPSTVLLGPGYSYGKAPKAIEEDWQKDTQDLLLHC